MATESGAIPIQAQRTRCGRPEESGGGEGCYEMDFLEIPVGSLGRRRDKANIRARADHEVGFFSQCKLCVALTKYDGVGMDGRPQL